MMIQKGQLGQLKVKSMHSPNKKIMPLLLILTLVLGGVGAYIYMDNFMDSPLSISHKAQATKPVQLIPKKVEVVPLTPPFVWPDDSSATIKELNDKHSALETLKLDVAIAEEEKKLKSLRFEPVFSTSPLPALSFPTEELSPNPAVQQPTAPVAKESSLLSIHGVDGKLGASFRLSSNKKAFVQEGDNVLGSKVKSISLDAVTLTNGKVFRLGE